MRNNKFSVGQKVFYTDLNQKKVSSKIIQDIEKQTDGSTVYWMQCYFGYYSEDLLYETHQQAVDAINHFKAFQEQLNE
jgi:hypothetical protein